MNMDIHLKDSNIDIQRILSVDAIKRWKIQSLWTVQNSSETEESEVAGRIERERPTWGTHSLGPSEIADGGGEQKSPVAHQESEIQTA